MKIRLYDDIPVKEREITLRLLRDEDGSVFIGVVDEAGHLVTEGSLIEFNRDMTFVRREGINPDLGISLNEERQLIESESY